MEQPLFSLPCYPERGIDNERKITHESLHIDRVGNLAQETLCHTLLPSGETLMEAKDNQAYTEGQRRSYAKKAEPLLVTTTTKGGWVTPMGQLVEEGTPGAIPQTAWFHALTIGDLKQMGMSIDDNTTVLSMLTNLMINEAERSKARELYGDQPPVEP